MKNTLTNSTKTAPDPIAELVKGHPLMEPHGSADKPQTESGRPFTKSFKGMDTGVVKLPCGGTMRMVVGTITVSVSISESGKKKRSNARSNPAPKM